MSVDPEAPGSNSAGIFGIGSTPTTARLILIPVPFDATTSYGTGAARGPEAILQASPQLELFDAENGRPYEAGICLLEPHAAVMQWNEAAHQHVALLRHSATPPAARDAHRAAVNRLGEQLNRWLEQECTQWLHRGHIVGAIGGDHASVFGAMAAHVARYPQLGVLHIDAHADCRQAYEGFTWSHASIIYNLLAHTPVKKVVQVAVRDYSEAEAHFLKENRPRLTTFFAADLAASRFAGQPWSDLVEAIIAELPQQVYISFDIDGLEPALCPNTGTPVPGGLSFYEALALFAAVRRSGRQLIGFDLTEVAPGPHGDEFNGNVGARILYKLCGHALLSQPGDEAWHVQSP